MRNDKRGEVTWDTFIPWIIAIVVLVLIIIAAYFLKDELIAFGDKIKHLFR